MRRKIFVKKLMGRPARLEVAAWVAVQPRHSYFSQRDVQLATQLGQAEVRQNLEDFVALGLLRRFENRWPYYQRLESPIWGLLKQLGAVVAAMEAGHAEPRLEAEPRNRRALRGRTINLPSKRHRLSK